MAPSPSRPAARTTLISHIGTEHGESSFMRVRECPGRPHASERLTLHGAFEGSTHESLHRTLLGLTYSTLPLVIDLRGIYGLDEVFLARLLKAQREIAPIRSVSFQIAADGPVLPLIQRLGLEERFGLELPKRPSRQIIPAPLKASQTRRTQWATNENH